MAPMSEVCKHCVHAACLEVCPTGAIIRTSSTPSSFSRTLAMGAATASRPVRSA